MAFVFPEDKADFKAPNGVTYSWDGTKWRTKTYSGAEVDGRLPYRLGTDKAARSARSGEPAVELVDAEDNYSNVKFFGVNGIQIESTISGIRFDGSELLGGDVDLTGYATIDYSDEQDLQLQNQIDELQVQKGSAAIYKCVSTAVDSINPRPGQFGVDQEDSRNVTRLQLGDEDSAGQQTKSVQVDDIIELISPSGDDSRFKCLTNNVAPHTIQVEFVSGAQGFAENVDYSVFIYPQNAAGATKDYVDAQDALHLPLTGGTLSGALVVPALKGLKASGPVITVGTASDNIKALIHANGLGEFASGKINGVLNLQRGKDLNQFKISPNSSDTDFATNIYSLNGGNMRFRTSHTNNESDNVGSHIILDSGGGAPETKIYHVVTPTMDHMAANKAYVDSNAGGGVELWGGASPPPSSDRGTLLLTTSNQLYIYTS